jgi:hypothetical protein
MSTCARSGSISDTPPILLSFTSQYQNNLYRQAEVYTNCTTTSHTAVVVVVVVVVVSCCLVDRNKGLTGLGLLSR